MDTEEQEEDLQAVEAQELKPEKLESNRTSQKGAPAIYSCHVCVFACVRVCLLFVCVTVSVLHCRSRQRRAGGSEAV